ncbi:MAG: cytochrome P450 [Cyanobacteria bacterium SBLK]|nr:cytochrome P450 [Cyanobacteria bacterium SBLK]
MPNNSKNLGPLEFFSSISASDSDLVGFDQHGNHTWLVNSPELAKRVLASEQSSFINPTHEYPHLRSILTDEGKYLLKLIDSRNDKSSTAFKKLQNKLFNHTSALILSIEEKLTTNKSIELFPFLKEWMMVLLADILFDVDASPDAKEFVKTWDIFEKNSLLAHETSASSLLPEHQQEWQSCNIFVSKIIQKYKYDRFENHKVYQRDGYEVFTTAITRTLLNGYNGMATALGWTLDLVRKDAKIQQKIFQETQLNKDSSNIELEQIADLTNLKLAIQTVKESLRLYPPAWLLNRTALLDIKLGEHRVFEGQGVCVCPYTLQRSPKYWQKADRFLPQRFAQSNHPEFAFIPFGGGSRRCPAAGTSLLMLAYMISALLKKFKITNSSSQPVAIWPLISLKPFPNITIDFEYRD